MLIPLHSKGQIVAHAIVDDADAWVGQFRWNVDKNGYARRTTDRITMHRLVMGCGPYDGVHEIDHLNHNKIDNRRENLRLVDRPTNQLNRAGKARGWNAPARGVYWMKRLGKFKAEITVARQRHYLGLFNTVEEAQAAWSSALSRLSA